MRVLLSGALIAVMAFGQTERLGEVVSVRTNTTNGPVDITPRRSGDKVVMHNTQVGIVFAYAYHLDYTYQYSGSLQLPDGWNWYDIEAIVEGTPGDDQVRLMFQALLADRFKLKVHRETREVARYELVAAKNGPKLKSAQAGSRIAVDDRPLPAGMGGVVLGRDGRHLAGKGGTMDQIVRALVGELRAPVVDRTGLMGTFDFDVRFVPENSPPDTEPGPSLATAIQEELGLRLEKSKGPVEVVVIDHIEKPSEN
jgi:uncharacterized protein (TIGR03435 family)